VKVRHTDGRRPSYSDALYVSIAPEDESRLSRELLTRKYKQTTVQSVMVVVDRLRPHYIVVDITLFLPY
jgi:hypothetical protein